MQSDKLFMSLVASVPVERSIISALKVAQKTVKDTLEILVIEMMIETHECKLQMIEQQIELMESTSHEKESAPTKGT